MAKGEDNPVIMTRISLGSLLIFMAKLKWKISHYKKMWSCYKKLLEI